MRSVIVSLFVVVLGWAVSADAALTFNAPWNDGDEQPDLLGQPPMRINNTSTWEADLGFYGHMNLRADGNGINPNRNRPLWNVERMRETLSAAGGTFNFWHKPEAGGDFSAFGGLVFNWEDWDDNKWQPAPNQLVTIEGSLTSSSLTFKSGRAANGAPNKHTEAYGRGFVNDTWYHLAFVLDLTAGSEHSEIYVNGSQIGSDLALTNIFNPEHAADSTGATEPNEGRFVIAGRHAALLNDAGVAEGDYDQFEIYDTPLSPTEIMDNYLAGRMGIPGHPIIPGDADLNREFNSTDIVQVLAANKYEKDQEARWAEGDWNGAENPAFTYEGGNRPPPGDGRFDSMDIVAALAGNHYEKGPVAALNTLSAAGSLAAGGPDTQLNSVPEPPSMVLLGLAGLIGYRRVLRRPS